MDVNTPADDAPSLKASLRIPVANLAAAMKDLRGLGRVASESESGEDVTQQHADLDQRLKTARDTEERFRTILQQRTGTVSDVLQVEEEIARVRGDIESMEAEQTNLRAPRQLCQHRPFSDSGLRPGLGLGAAFRAGAQCICCRVSQRGRNRGRDLPVSGRLWTHDSDLDRDSWRACGPAAAALSQDAREVVAVRPGDGSLPGNQTRHTGYNLRSQDAGRSKSIRKTGYGTRVSVMTPCSTWSVRIIVFGPLKT